MICPKCGGSGKIFCSMCKGTGLYHEDDLMTEQEYLQTCNTEQLAEFLSKLPMRPCIVCPKWETYCRSHSGSPCWEDGNEYDLWNVWLKQPHTVKE